MQLISSFSSLHGPSGAWMNVLTLYYRKKQQGRTLPLEVVPTAKKLILSLHTNYIAI